jgi:site-specific recombinase XerD
MNGKIINIKNSLPSSELTLHIEDWIISLEATGLDPKTRHTYSYYVYCFAWWLLLHQKNVSPIREFNTKDCRAFLSYLRSPQSNRWGLTEDIQKRHSPQTLTVSSIYIIVSVIKQFFQWMVNEHILDITPWASVKIGIKRNNDKPIKSLSEKEIEKLFSVLTDKKRMATYEGARDLAMFLLLHDTGLRRFELLALRLCDVDPDNKTVQVVRGKGGKSRIVPFGTVTAHALTEYLSNHRLDQENDRASAFWLTRDGYALSYGGFGSIMNGLKKATGLGDKLHAHALRHTFASDLVQTMNIDYVSKLLGHASLAMTEHYLHATPETLRRAYQGNAPTSRLKLDALTVKRRRGRPRKYQE